MDARIGLALGRLTAAGVQLRQACLCSREHKVLDTLVSWLLDEPEPTLLAIDAPLGWPSEMSIALVAHSAGEEIRIPANRMFRRATDRFVHERLRKTPLDVGADRIARTAHFALALLGELRRRLGREIPLAWSTKLDQLSAIEVYPAATLIAHGISATGYKRVGQIDTRESIIKNLRSRVVIDDQSCSIIRQSADALDAVICLLAGADFLRGRTIPPQDLELARKEGWIWFPGPQEAGDQVVAD